MRGLLPSLSLLVLGAAFPVTIAACDRGDGVDATDDALAQAPPQPKISRILEAGGGVLWQAGTPGRVVLKPGQEVVVQGTNFGRGPDVELSKLLVGSSRALERDLPLFDSNLHLLSAITGGEIYDEDPAKVIDAWKKDILAWSEGEIRFKVPTTAHGDSALVVQVQRYVDTVKDPSGAPVLVRDPMMDFLATPHKERLPRVPVGVPGPPSASEPILVTVDNREFEAARARGEADFWAYDYNLGVTQKLAKVDWDAAFGGRAVDPVTGQTVRPADFGAIFIDRDVEVPAVAREVHDFAPYPIANPLQTILSSSLKAGKTTPIQWVGYVKAEGKDPLAPGIFAKGEWIGFNCAACHARRIEFEASPGRRVAKIFPGLPNHKWNAKWTTYSGEVRGLKSRERAPGSAREESVDKTMLMHSLPDGTAEASLTPEQGHGQFANDFHYSPVAIPIITKHTPVRRALSRGEMIAGFEGSYLRPQAPEGTMGPMSVSTLKDLTTYMTTLDRDHDQLVAIGMFEWLARKGRLGDIDGAGQGEIVADGLARTLDKHPKLKARVDRGAAIYKRDCQSCHAPNFGTNTDERLFGFDEVGTYFSPSLWNRAGGGIRTAMIRELWWVQGRGLLHDGHVRSADADHVDSAEVLLDPDRCNPSSDLFERLYTLSAQSFRIPKGTPEQERATRAQGWFVDWPFGGGGDESRFLYWDYQKMRRSFGPREFGGTTVKELPLVPHPWCAKKKSDVEDLLAYLFTL